jgi:hypothetical protein
MSINPAIIEANYFEAEASIIARVSEFAPELAAIYTPFVIGDITEASQKSPSVHVIFAGEDVISDDAGRGSRKPVDQKWLIVLALRNAKAQLAHTESIRNDAGVIIPKLLNALSGWKPTENMRELVRKQAPTPGYSSSFAYFPLMFHGRIIT